MTGLTTSKTDKPPTTGSTSTTTVVDDKHQGQFAVQQMMMFPFVKPIYDGDEVPPFDKSGGRRSVIGRALDHTTTDHGDILMIHPFQDIMKIIVCLYGADKFLYNRIDALGDGCSSSRYSNKDKTRDVIQGLYRLLLNDV